MAAKKTKTTLKKTDHKGKKGGISAISPEIIGATTGAIIGGAAGLMLANQKTRQNLAVAKDKAIDTASEAMQYVKIDKEGLQDKATQTVQSAGKKITK